MDYLKEGNANLENDEFFVSAKRRAESGDSDGMVLLGRAYKRGMGTEKNAKKAFEWFEKAANAGNSEGMWRLGCAYGFGEGVEKSQDKDFEWTEKSAEAGNSGGMWRLGYAYEYGIGTEENAQKAFEWFEKAANAGNGTGMWRLGYAYERGKGVEKNDDLAYAWYQKSADTNERTGVWFLGHAYLLGIGVQKDTKIATELIIKSAEMGKVNAYSSLADEYLRGEHVNKSYEKAKEYYEKETEIGNGFYGYKGLANLYEHGYGVEESAEKMVEYLEKAYETSTENAEVYYKLGYAYYDGNGVKRDLNKAKELIERALLLGYNCSFRLEVIKKELGERDENEPMGEFAEQMVKNKLAINKLFAKVEKDLKKEFGNTWDRLQDNTRVFLNTAMASFVTLYAMGNHARGCVDFSSAITPMFKALESEVGHYLFSGYMRYLKENEISPFEFGEGKRFFIDMYAKKYLEPDELGEFSLGSVLSLMGIKKDSGRASEVEDEAAGRRGGVRELIMDEPMVEYLKKIVKENAFSLYSERELKEYFIVFAETIDDMTHSTRNKAAHVGVMSYAHAVACGNQIIKKAKLLKTFVDTFK